MIEVHDLDLSSPVAFLIVAALALIDGVVPLVPARTAVIGLGVVAGTGDLRAYPLLVVATGAAFVSDNVSYWLGARFSSRLEGLLLRGARSRQLWAWVAQQVDEHGLVIVALARVLPGGPTPITLTAGSVRMPVRLFRIAAASSAALWSAYAFGVGLLGDAVVGHNPLLALLAGLGLAAVLNLILRAVVRHRRLRVKGDAHPTGSIQSETKPNPPDREVFPPTGSMWMRAGIGDLAGGEVVSRGAWLQTPGG